MAKGKKTKKEVEPKVEKVTDPVVKLEAVTKYFALYRFEGNRIGAPILVGDEVFAKDFGGEKALEERVAKKHVEKKEVEV